MFSVRVRRWLLPGRSEKSSMHSLKPLANRRSLSCCRIATPMQKGKEEVPKSRVSHRWKILCRGNTSAKEMGQQMTYCEYSLQPLHFNSCALIWSTGILYHSCCYVVCFCNSRLCIFRFQNRNYPCL